MLPPVSSGMNLAGSLEWEAGLPLDDPAKITLLHRNLAVRIKFHEPLQELWGMRSGIFGLENYAQYRTRLRALDAFRESSGTIDKA
jgi:hypothetical protein